MQRSRPRVCLRLVPHRPVPSRPLSNIFVAHLIAMVTGKGLVCRAGINRCARCTNGVIGMAVAGRRDAGQSWMAAMVALFSFQINVSATVLPPATKCLMAVFPCLNTVTGACEAGDVEVGRLSVC